MVKKLTRRSSKAKAKDKATYVVSQHILVPKHRVLSEKEKKELLESYKITLSELPKILIGDAVLSDLDVKAGDVIHVEKMLPVVGKVDYYRGVVDE